MEIRNYINGNFINSLSEQNIRVINPSNQSTIGFIDAFNLPGGGYKKSGNGREWGELGFEEFLEIKAILGYNAAS